MKTPIAIGSLALLALALVAASPAYAQQPTVVTLQASDQAVSIGGALELVIAVSGPADGEPSLSGLQNFQVVGASTGSNVQIINGSITMSRSYTYQLLAKRPGAAEVTATIRAGNRRVNSNALRLTVLAPGAASPSAGPPPTPPEPAARGGQGAKPLFLQAVVKPDATVVNGMVIAEYYLYVREDISPRRIELTDAPQFTGFVAHELTTSNTLSFVDQRVGGTNYHVALVKRWALFPVSAGTATIGSLALSAQVPRSSHHRGFGFDPFGDLDQFMGGQQQVEIRSDPLNITVTPPPAAGRPAGWNGAVGDWRISATLDRAEAPVGEPIELRIKVAGAGNADAVPRPPLALSEGLRVYSESDKATVTPGVTDLTAEHNFSIMLIATTPGEYAIPPIRLPYYDPQQKLYRVTETPALSFKVTGQAQANQPRSLGVVSRESVELRGRDLRYIRGNHTSLRHRAAPLAASPFLWIALGLWPLAVAGLVLYQARVGRLRTDQGAWRSRRALKEARRRLAEVKTMVRDGDAARFYSELHRAVLNFMADKFDAAAPGLSPEELTALLRGRGVPDETINELFARWREADEVRFAGRDAAATERQTSYEKARDLLADLSRFLER